MNLNFESAREFFMNLNFIFSKSKILTLNFLFSKVCEVNEFEFHFIKTNKFKFKFPSRAGCLETCLGLAMPMSRLGP